MHHRFPDYTEADRRIGDAPVGFVNAVLVSALTYMLGIALAAMVWW